MSNLMGCDLCACNTCNIRGVYCDDFGCMSCEEDMHLGQRVFCTYRRETHKCLDCAYEYPDCEGFSEGKLEFGDGVGGDNVIYCSKYKNGV